MNLTSPDQTEDFGSMLRRLRQRGGLTQEALAALAQLSARAISDLERGVRHFPRYDTLRLLADALGLSDGDRTALSEVARRPTQGSGLVGIAPRRSSALELSAMVGRTSELAALTEYLRLAEIGRAGVVLIGGEPGIGKSRLIAEFMGRALELGWLSLSGRAYDTPAMPPYLPFAEALQGYLLDRPHDESLARLVTDAPEIANLVPELRDDAPRAAAPSLGPEADRYRLFEAVSKVLGVLATAPGHRGLVLCLDDLQWADDSTLMLLEHVVRRLASKPFLLVATYRDFELNRAQGLAHTFEILVRERLSQTVELTRLSLDEVTLMLTEMGKAVPPVGLARLVFRETEGNPLFIEEVFQYLAQRGLLFNEAGEWQTDFALNEIEVPQSLRLVIGRRLQQSSESCRTILATAATIGRSFDIELLLGLSGQSESEFFDALEEAQSMHFLAASATVGDFIFSHELIRQTLLGNLSLPRRQRLHERIAQEIERVYSVDMAPHLASLATHYRLANTPAGLTKAIDYAVRAAEQAYSVFAYRESAALYEQALDALDVLQPDNKAHRCDLLLAMGRALLPAGETRRVMDVVAPQALQIAEEIADEERALVTCRLAMEGLYRQGMRMITATAEWATWAQRYDRYAGQGTADRIRLDVEMAEHLHLTGHEAEARRLRAEALAQARIIGSRQELLNVASFSINYTQAPGYQVERLRLAEEVAGWPIEGANPRTLAHLYAWQSWTFWDWGNRTAAQAAWQRLYDLSLRTQDSFVALVANFARASQAAIDGDLVGAVELAFDCIREGDDLGSPVIGRQSADYGAFRPLLSLGRANEAQDVLALVPNALGMSDEPILVRPRRLLALAHRGHYAKASALLDSIMAERRFEDHDASGNQSTAELLPLLEAAVILGAKSTAKVIAHRLQPAANLIEAHGGTQTSVGRHLGDAAALVGMPQEARDYYRQAIGVCRRVKFRPELALTRLSLADLLLRHFPNKATSARSLLRTVVGQFEMMGMRPALNRACALEAEFGIEHDPKAPVTRLSY